MAFKYKKIKYENIYSWSQSDEGTCFYCKKDKPITAKLLGDKGICDDCLHDFEIGNVGADRHVLEKIMPEFNSHEEVAEWFEKMNVKMVLNDIIDDTYIYHAINDEKTYNDFRNKMKENGYAPLSEEYMYSYNSVEISEDGKIIHIIY